MPQPITVGDNLPEPESLLAIQLTIITIECFAYLFLPSRNEIYRRKGGHQEVSAMREHLD